MEDRIILNSLAVSAKIGCSEEERAFSQPLKLDIEVGCCLKAAGKSGKISDTLCYDQIRKIASQLSSSKEWNLVEELGEAISDEILGSFSTAQSTLITVKKMVFSDCQWAGATITRHR